MTSVRASSAINMIGPYLAASVRCPTCAHENQLVHLEGPASPVKPVSICKHMAAHVVDDDGTSYFEFRSAA